MQGVDFLHNKLYNDYINLNVQRGNIKMSNEILVFIDTNEYRRCGHNFKSTPMRKIHELASKNTIHLLSSTVVVGEAYKTKLTNFLQARKSWHIMLGALEIYQTLTT